jgi:hypothetical protein
MRWSVSWKDIDVGGDASTTGTSRDQAESGETSIVVFVVVLSAWRSVFFPFVIDSMTSMTVSAGCRHLCLDWMYMSSLWGAAASHRHPLFGPRSFRRFVMLAVLLVDVVAASSRGKSTTEME